MGGSSGATTAVDDDDDARPCGALGVLEGESGADFGQAYGLMPLVLPLLPVRRGLDGVEGGSGALRPCLGLG